MSIVSTNPLRLAFASHPRQWRDFRFVYPVISRRSKGLSVGVNLNPDGACNFDCIYCCVDRRAPLPRIKVDVGRLESELETLIAGREELFKDPQFAEIPPEFRRLNDIAFSGDGEPTAVPAFGPAVRAAAGVLERLGLSDVKVVIITDACYLTRPEVAETLRFLDRHNGEIWAKLDAGTETYFRRVNRANYPLSHVLDNLRAASRERAIVIQSMFMRIEGAAPPADELEAYLGRLRWLLDEGGQIKLVQVYTVARWTTESYVSALAPAELEQIAERVRSLGLAAEVFA